MSYSTVDTLKTVKNKTVMFLNIKTSGILQEKSKLCKPEEKYDIYTNNTYYDSSRIVEIEYFFCQSFLPDKQIKSNEVIALLRKPTDFEISETATNTHNITQKYAITHGIKIKEIFDGDFCKRLKKCDYIIGYDIFLHMSVLLNELHRKEMTRVIDHLKTLFQKQKILCLGSIVGTFCKPKGWIKASQYQIPNLGDVYFNMFGEKKYPENNTILACVNIAKFILTNETFYKKQNSSHTETDNFGKRWKDEEVEILEEEIKSKMKTKDIAKNHARTVGAVRSKIMSMAVDEMMQGKTKEYICDKYGYNNNVYDMCVIKMETIKTKPSKQQKTEKLLVDYSNNNANTNIMSQQASAMSGSMMVQILAYLSKIDKKLDILLQDKQTDIHNFNSNSESESNYDSDEYPVKTNKIKK